MMAGVASPAPIAYCLTSGTIATTSAMFGTTLESIPTPTSSSRLATNKLLPKDACIATPSALITPVLSSDHGDYVWNISLSTTGAE